jgi:hypothetical protein
MTDVMQRCVPLSTGALAPDLRVNYQFGLVLGVDEFEQQSWYHRERDERASRALHGYGTTSGLHVTARRPASAPDDVELRVEPGIAVDQWGRPVVVRTAQCALIGAWLAAQETAAANAGLPSPMEVHGHPSGDITLYVVASYAECEDALVPLPGNPCAADDDLMASSRIRDSWNLELRWEPPAMAAWDGVRTLADLLATIELHDDSPLHTDEDALAAHIRALAGGPAPTIALPDPPMLPRAEGRAALDRLLTVWTTEVRPRFAPSLISPDGDPAVLLTTITVAADPAFDTAAPVVLGYTEPDDEGRPYLAPTMLLQELAVLGGDAATIVMGSPIAAPTSSHTPLALGVLFDMVAGGVRQLLLWPSLGASLTLAATIDVRRNGGAPVACRTSAGPVAGTILIAAPPGAPFRDREAIEALVDVTTARIREADGSERSLADWADRNAIDLIGRGPTGVIALTHVLSLTPPAAPVIPPQRQVRDLVNASWQNIETLRTSGVELWFHLDSDPGNDSERISDLPRDAVRVLAEVENGSTPVDLEFEIVALQHNVFLLAIQADQIRTTSRYLRVVLQLDRIGVDQAGVELAKLSEVLGVNFAGTEPDLTLHTSYVRVEGFR